jgi:hypothetical protein
MKCWVNLCEFGRKIEIIEKFPGKFAASRDLDLGGWSIVGAELLPGLERNFFGDLTIDAFKRSNRGQPDGRPSHQGGASACDQFLPEPDRMHAAGADV